MSETIEVRATWKSVHTLDVPDGMSHDQAVAEYNNGNHDIFDDIDSSTAELTDWEAS